jgi:hypothetical protein
MLSSVASEAGRSASLRLPRLLATSALSCASSSSFSVHSTNSHSILVEPSALRPVPCVCRKVASRDPFTRPSSHGTPRTIRVSVDRASSAASTSASGVASPGSGKRPISSRSPRSLSQSVASVSWIKSASLRGRSVQKARGVPQKPQKWRFVGCWAGLELSYTRRIEECVSSAKNACVLLLYHESGTLIDAVSGVARGEAASRQSMARK